jgi:hypothetical protein
MKFIKCTNWGKTLFIYITKCIYTGPASLKTLPLDLEPPLQGKEDSRVGRERRSRARSWAPPRTSTPRHRLLQAGDDYTSTLL